MGSGSGGADVEAEQYNHPEQAEWQEEIRGASKATDGSAATSSASAVGKDAGAASSTGGPAASAAGSGGGGDAEGEGGPVYGPMLPSMQQPEMPFEVGLPPQTLGPRP